MCWRFAFVYMHVYICIILLLTVLTINMCVMYVSIYVSHSTETPRLCNCQHLVDVTHNKWDLHFTNIELSKLGGLWQAGCTLCMHAATAVYTLFMVYHEPVLMTRISKVLLFPPPPPPSRPVDPPKNVCGRGVGERN